MYNTLKSLSFMLVAPILLSYLFSVNVIKSSSPDISRSPALEKKIEKVYKPYSVKQNVFNYLVTKK